MLFQYHSDINIFLHLVLIQILPIQKLYLCPLSISICKLYFFLSSYYLVWRFYRKCPIYIKNNNKDLKDDNKDLKDDNKDLKDDNKDLKDDNKDIREGW